METMKDAGIDISFYFTLYGIVINKQSSHQGLSLIMISNSAGWTTDSTFAKFYNKPVHENFGTFVINPEQT